jgi:hypothetical protein
MMCSVRVERMMMMLEEERRWMPVGQLRKSSMIELILGSPTHVDKALQPAQLPTLSSRTERVRSHAGVA